MTLDHITQRIESLISGGVLSPHTPQAWATLEAIGDLDHDDRYVALGYLVHRLEWINHPAPEAWLVRVALYGLGRALSDDGHSVERVLLARGMSRLALVLSASDHFGRDWEVTRIGPRGAEVRALSHIGQGAYVLSIADAGAEPVRYTTPALQMWWRDGGAYWACTGTCARAKGGMFARGADGHFDTVPLMAALIGWDHDEARVNVAALRTWHATRRAVPVSDHGLSRRIEA